MTARIYRPAPNAMQSGRGKSKKWVLVHEQALMVRSSTRGTRKPLRSRLGSACSCGQNLSHAKTLSPRELAKYQQPVAAQTSA